MGDNHSFLALDWVKGEIEETLKQARQALEAFVENPEDNTRMRFCLAYLHQVHGTLQMVEFYGAALLAEEMEKLCLALINAQVSRIGDGQEVLMRAILQLPPYLERVKASRRDLPVVLLPLLNDLRAVRGEPLLSETALFTPDLSAGERAPIHVTLAAADPALLKKIRQKYQLALLGVLRHDNLAHHFEQMTQVFSRLEKLAGASPLRELWQVAAALIEGLTTNSVDAGTSIKMLLGQVDRQLRASTEEDIQCAPTELLKNLLYYVAKSAGDTPRLRAVKTLYRLDDALPGEALVNEERARMSGPDREAMKSVVDALCEELARVKDTLDLFVCRSDKSMNDLTSMVPILKQVADTVAVLGLGQPRRILQEQIECIDSITSSGELPADARLLDIAGALLYVEATLMGMVTERPLGQAAINPGAEFSAQDQLSDAQAAVLRESRSALEKVKDAIIEYIASQWNPAHLEIIPDLLITVRGGLSILSLNRPVTILERAGHYVSSRLLADHHRPDWQEMDILADIITSVEYYLERIANDTHGNANLLDIAENGLSKLNMSTSSAAIPSSNDANAAEPATALNHDHGIWDNADEAVFEAQIAAAVAAPHDTDSSDDFLLDALASADFSTDNTQGNNTLIRTGDANDTLPPLELNELGEINLEATATPQLLDDVDDLNVLDDFTLDDLARHDFTESATVTNNDGATAPPINHAAPPADLTHTEEIAITPAHDATLRMETPIVPPPEIVASTPAVTESTVASTTKKPSLPVFNHMPEDDHSFDDEIREIFVEEAEEVMENINTYFPKWAANFENTEALLEFRRGFHTLKGSGRMVGAKVVAELAWVFENMLNKVRDKILPADQVMVNLISECLSVIPGLVHDFCQRRTPHIDTSPLMAAANDVAHGEHLSTLDVARAAEQAHAGPLSEDNTSAADFDAFAASLAPVAETAITAFNTQDTLQLAPTPALESVFIDNDSDEHTLEPRIEISDTPAFAAEATQQFLNLAEALPAFATDTDTTLLEIFASEATTHLEEIQQFLSQLDHSRSSAGISDEVLRALHTLKGSAGMAGIMPVVDVAAPMEHLFKDLRNQGGQARREHLQALLDAHDLIASSIADLGQGGDGRVDGAANLIAHIRQLDHDRQTRLEREQSEKLGNNDAPDVTIASVGLVGHMMSLGLDHVLDAPWELEGWLRGDTVTTTIYTLQQELQRLAPAAQHAAITPLALLAERLAMVYERLARQELAMHGELINDLAAAHDEIINIFDTLAASQTVYPNESVLARLLDLLETPDISSTTLSDEPSSAAFETHDNHSLAERMTDADNNDWVAPANITTPDTADPELMAIFLEEAEEVLEAAQTELDLWQQAPTESYNLGVLQRHLHTLKGGALLAEIRPLGDLAHELEFLYEGLMEGRYQAAPELSTLLQNCHDSLAGMVSALRTHQNCPSGLHWVNAINTYRRGPHTGLPSNLNPDTPRTEATADGLTIDTELAFEGLDDSLLIAVEAEANSVPETLLPLTLDPITLDNVFINEVALEDNDAIFAEFFPAAANVIVPAPVIATTASTPTAAVTEAAGFDPELLEIFLEEAREIVDASSEELARWHTDTHNTLPVQQLQRGLHTLKGGARMAEITALGDLAHHLENLYEALCDGRLSATPVLFSLLYRCHDRLAAAVECLRQGQPCPQTNDLIALIIRYIADPDNFQEIPDSVSLTTFTGDITEPHAATPTPLAPKSIAAAAVPDQVDDDILEIFLDESNELAQGIESALLEWVDARSSYAPLDALLRHLHTLKGGARLAGLRELGDLAHAWENDLMAFQSQPRLTDDDFFAGLGNRHETLVAHITTIRSRLNASLAATPAAAPELEPTSSTPKRPLPLSATPRPATLTASGERILPPPMQGGFSKDTGARGPQEMIRVPSDLLEKLVNLAGETSITRSRVEMGVHGFAQTVEEMGSTIQRLAEQLRRMDAEMESQIISRHNEVTGAKYEEFDPLEMDQYSSLNQLSKALTESASDLLDLKSTLIDKARDTETLLLQQSRINTELQEGLMRSRMVPFSRLVPRLKRIVRQTGQEVGKPADLEVINAEGEMDRTLLERIVAPLEHMLRNAVDHGLEDSHSRNAAGKPAQGRVSLTLAREGGDVVLVLADDGRGINITAVRQKALERGLISPDQDISDQDVIQFIFHAGFSTAAAVTQISGRGVGMDVVQSEIKQMGGVVSIHSVTGQGTTFTIRLPFTVAVNRALMVRISEDVYAIPLAQIEGIVRASPYELETYYAPNAPLFEYAGVPYRLSYLGEFVHNVKAPTLLGHVLPLPVLLIRGGEYNIAIQVDQLIGSREIVVKSVGLQLATVAGISGATILGDGSVVIILDVIAMLRAAARTTPRIDVTLSNNIALEDTRTRTVMVVDDSVTVRKVTSRLLERHGYQVLLAKDGMDAIAKLEDQKPDLMLLDIEMPRMDGFEVASLVRHNPHLEDLPIIMITSRTGEKHRERAFQIGVNCYMGKPFQEEQLLETIAKLLAASTVR